MALSDDILQALVNAGKELKADLWTSEDLDMLKQRALDLAGLEAKAVQATDPDKKNQYQLAASLIIDHVKVTALTRMLLAQKDALDALGKLFLQVLTKYLLPLLPALL
jgi:hypothetical protein